MTSKISRAEACGLIAGAVTAAAFPQAVRANPVPSRVMLGNERLMNELLPSLRGKRLGLVTNHTGLLPSGESLIDALKADPRADLRALYAPEHGLRGDHRAGTTVSNAVDAATGLPIYSLYGKTRKPTAAMLAGIDVLLFDIQDVGARTYTYISTLATVMQAAGEHGKSVWVLDRPNPIGGALVEGPVLDPRFASFVGLYALPMRHGMTVGEIAQLYRRTFGIACDLQVVAMADYRRDMLWPQTGLRWVATSPNIQSFASALCYLTTGPIGSLGLRIGIGTPGAFTVALAPGVAPERFAERMNARRLAGVTFTPDASTVSDARHGDRLFGGVAIRVHDPRVYLSVRTGIEIANELRRDAPERIVYPVSLDRDWGTDSFRRMLQSGVATESMEAAWAPRLIAFRAQREAVLIYK